MYSDVAGGGSVEGFTYSEMLGWYGGAVRLCTPRQRSDEPQKR